MSQAAKPFYEFGPYRIDTGRCRLLRGETPLPLPPKAFDLLLLLIAAPNRVLSKGELMQALWPDTFVDDANLTQHVFTLRKALGTQPDGRAYIETVPRRGYSFAAPVRGRAADSAPTPPPTAVTAAAVTSERKHISVLHGSVANAAALAERLSADGFDEVMHALVAHVVEETARYEAVLRRMRPDAFEVVFGGRAVHEDDPLRAVLSALAITSGLPRLFPDPDDRPALRIGIDTGSAVVSRRATDGEVEYSALGEPIRMADLMQQLAESGAILIGDATRRAVDGIVACETTALAVGGRAVFGVKALAGGASRPHRLARTLAPFVGRVHELGLLMNIAARAREGRGQAAGISGEPGIGKSRLLLELVRTVPDMTVLEARCVSYGSLIPCLPLAEVVRAYCGITDGEAGERIHHRVRAAMAPLGVAADADTWVLRLLGVAETSADASTPEAIKARIFDIVCTLLLRASTLRPLLVVVEDVHWIDRTSEEFLTMLMDRAIGARVVVIVSFRPGYCMPWRDASCATQITLPPLEAADGEMLVDAVARETPVPPQLSAEILAKAEGNPFFLEELTRAVVEHGAERGIPDTVHGVIMARLDRLPDAAKQLLQTASVIGREVPLRVLRRVWPGTSDIASELEMLCRLDFLFERIAADDRVFVFRHALTQDVAYDSLLARRRRELHLQTARALEEVYAGRLDDVTETLAHHYVRTDLATETVTWLIRAADRAARVYANAEAMLHLDLAQRRIERLAQGPARDRLELDIAWRHAHSLYFLGRWRDSVDILQPHAVRVSRLNDPALAGTYSFWLAHMYTRLGDQRLAAEHAFRAIEAGERAGDRGIAGKAHGVLALSGHWSGNTADGIAHGDEAVRILSGQPDQRWWLGMAHFYLAMNHLLTGAFDTALDAARRADAVGRDIGDPRLRSYAGWMAGWIEMARGNTEAAIALCRASLERAPDRVCRAYASLLLSYVLLEHGVHAEPLERLPSTLGELEAFSFPQWHALALILVGEALRREARLDDARQATERGLELAARVRYDYAIVLGRRVTASIARDAA